MAPSFFSAFEGSPLVSPEVWGSVVAGFLSVIAVLCGFSFLSVTQIGHLRCTILGITKVGQGGSMKHGIAVIITSLSVQVAAEPQWTFMDESMARGAPMMCELTRSEWSFRTSLLNPGILPVC